MGRASRDDWQARDRIVARLLMVGGIGKATFPSGTAKASDGFVPSSKTAWNDDARIIRDLAASALINILKGKHLNTLVPEFLHLGLCHVPSE